MDKIANTKTEFRLRQWTQIIQTCQSSGITVVSWCSQNNVNTKSYYYWLRRIRSIACENNALQLSIDSQSIVPVSRRQQQKQAASVTIHLSSFTVDIHNGATRETVEIVLAALKSLC